MRKSIRRTSHRKSLFSDKYSRKSRITNTARNKNRSRNHKKSRKQMYVGGGGCASTARGGVIPKEVTDWWYQSEVPNGDGYYTWTQMRPNETIEMNQQYHDWAFIHNPVNFQMYRGFDFNIMYSHDGETGGMGHTVHIYFPSMEMTDPATGYTKKIEKTTRCENRAPVSPAPIVTPPFIKPIRPQMDAFGQPQPAPSASSPLTSATWYWESDDGQGWNKFTLEDSNFLENAYTSGKETAIHETKPWTFHFNTVPMYQQNTTPRGTSRRILREV